MARTWPATVGSRAGRVQTLVAAAGSPVRRRSVVLFTASPSRERGYPARTVKLERSSSNRQSNICSIQTYVRTFSSSRQVGTSLQVDLGPGDLGACPPGSSEILEVAGPRRMAREADERSGSPVQP